MSASLRPVAAPDAQTLLQSALECHGAGRLGPARELYERLLALEPDHVVGLHHLGLIAHAQGAHADGAALVQQAIAQKPDYAAAYANLGAILRALKRYDEAIAAERRAIVLDPTAPQAHSNLGSILEDTGAQEEALAAYRQAMKLNSGFTEAHTNAASLLRRMGRHEEAASVCADLVARRPDAAVAHAALGRILREMHRKDDALSAYRRALALQPNLVDVHIGLGHLAVDAGDIDAAIAAYEKAIALKPDLAEAYFNLAAAHEARQDVARALPMFREAVRRAPDLLAPRYECHHMRSHACDWDGFASEEQAILAGLENGASSIRPFPLVAMNASPTLLHTVATRWAQRYGAPSPPHPRPAQAGRPQRRLRIGYVSADFCRHATANLMAELFERHDRSRYEIFAYSHGPDDGSAMRQRLEAAFEHFVEIGALPTAAAAARIRDDSIDILIDLKGYTKSNRFEIFAARPAPVQVSFIGYPSTTGCGFIDYVIADATVLPFEEQPQWSERIVHLPECYQPNDAQRRIADQTPTRHDCGLPPDGFVFCSFNGPYKITPAVFDVWMRLLVSTPGSVLWLYEGNGLAKDNLRREAAARGVDPGRLVFAPPMALPEHLARHRLADLFLDTIPCNAHTTASDALWAGLPVLTCRGDAFAGRVAASLVKAVGLPELVQPNLAAYEATALRLAQSPELLTGLRQKLLDGRRTAPLFDTPRFARHLEAAFDRMWDGWAAGRPAEGFAVASLPAAVAAPAAETAVLVRIAYDACPLCGGADWQPLQLPKGGHGQTQALAWQHCGACGHVHASGSLSTEAEARLFATDDPTTRVGRDMEGQRLVSGRIVERVARLVAGGDWLDIGCGTGSLLFTAAEFGFRAVALDPRAAAVTMLRTLGVEAHEGGLADLDAPGRFAVVSIGAAFTRAVAPREALRRLRALLRPDGVLLIEAPNMDSLIFKLLQANGANPHLGDPAQVHLYDRARLSRLLTEGGFAIHAYAVSERSRAAMEIIARRA